MQSFLFLYAFLECTEELNDKLIFVKIVDKNGKIDKK